MLAAAPMPAKLYAIHGSHPCRAVARAMRMKGIDYKIVEIVPPAQVIVQPLVFRKRTVPGVKFENGEKVAGSREIMRRLDQMRPDPPLFPPGIEEAERWGAEEFQSRTRRIFWTALKHSQDSIPSFQEGARLPALPKPVIKVLAPGISFIEQRLLNKATDEIGTRDARELVQDLDRIDAWLADGTLGGDPPNAADLQIATSLRLLMALDDVAQVADARPCGQWARRLFPDQAGHVPPGVISVG
jgi:glutathione S-transferase